LMMHRATSPGEPDDAFEPLFRREFGSISRTAYLIVGDWEVAREIAQDAFVQALRHWEEVRDMESPGGWVRRVAIRRAVRSRHREARGRTFLRTFTPSAVEEPDLAGVDVHRALLTLPPRQRAALALYYLEDRPVNEIAILLGCGEVTVRTHLARGRQALAARLGEEFTDEPR
jgi:RNA polymerase sigma factor (sigma-70 family)